MCACHRRGCGPFQEAEKQRVADDVELQAWAADAPAVLAAVLAANRALEDPVAKVQTQLSFLHHNAVNICSEAACCSG